MWSPRRRRAMRLRARQKRADIGTYQAQSARTKTRPPALSEKPRRRGRDRRLPFLAGATVPVARRPHSWARWSATGECPGATEGGGRSKRRAQLCRQVGPGVGADVGIRRPTGHRGIRGSGGVQEGLVEAATGVEPVIKVLQSVSTIQTMSSTARPGCTGPVSSSSRGS